MDQLSVKTIFILGLAIRVILLLVGFIMDNYTTVRLTDIDYQVVTDGARYVLQGKSPFERHTYRYPPFLAFLMLPNIFLNSYFGKVVLIFGDCLVGVFIQKINAKISLNYQKAGLLIWFFNPLTILNSPRGSCDVIVSLFLLGVLLLLKNRKFTSAAILYGFAIHFRIYPIIFCVGIYLYVMKKHKAGIFNWASIKFGLISLASLLSIVAFFYLFYGNQFLYECYGYHLTRKDHRHNFSLNFMMIYLNFKGIDSLTSAALTMVPLVLILSISFKFYKNLKIVMFLTSLVFVAFNKVVTAQYFVWYLQFLPVLTWQLFGQINSHQLKLSGVLYACWFMVCILWNNCAHRFEALGQDMFLYFHITNSVFFILNVMIVFTSIKNYQIFEAKKEEQKDEKQVKKLE